jgi:hypothetical protein
MEEESKFSQVYKHKKIFMYMGGGKELRKTWKNCTSNKQVETWK